MIRVVACGFRQISVPEDGFIVTSLDLAADQLKKLVDRIRQQESREPLGVFARLYRHDPFFEQLTLEVVSPRVGECVGEDSRKVWGMVVGDIDEITTSDSISTVIGGGGNAKVDLHYFYDSTVTIAAANNVNVARRALSVSLSVDRKPWLTLLAMAISGDGNVLNILHLAEPGEGVFQSAVVLAAALRDEVVLAAWPTDVHRIEALFEGKAK